MVLTPRALQILTIGDYPKHDVRKYYRENILPSLDERMRAGLDFERLYEAFGGKLAHWQDYITDYGMWLHDCLFGFNLIRLPQSMLAENSMVSFTHSRIDSTLIQIPVKQSSHFLQAHALLNLHVIHSAQAPPPNEEQENPMSPRQANANGHAGQPEASGTAMQRSPSQPLGSGAGFRIYSPLTLNLDPHASPASLTPAGTSADTAAEFTAIQLLKVMNRFAQPGTRALSYFHLCREMGARAVDGMVRGRILDLRWTDPISKEGWDPRVLSMRVRESIHANRVPGAGSSGTMVNEVPEGMDEDDMVALSDEEYLREEQRLLELRGGVEEEEEIIGPKLVPTTPIMRFAMKEVVQEYYDDDDRTVSEYASLSEVEEY